MKHARKTRQSSTLEVGSSTRRAVLGRGLALGAGAVAFGRAPALLGFSEPDPVRIGIVGTGSRGTGLQRVFNDLTGARITALCDVLPDRLARAGEIDDAVSGSARRFHDHRQLIDDPDVDAVVISATLSEHHRIARAAVDAGQHVYCEKMLTLESEHALDLVEAQKARSADRIFQVGYQYRYHPLYSKVADLLRDGAIGDAQHITLQWNRNGDWRRKVPDPALERQINWRMYTEYSGGLLAELGSHQLDFVDWIFDEHPDGAVGTGGIDTWKDGRETFDNVHVAWSYPSGRRVTFTSLTGNAYEGYKMTFRGREGTLEMGIDWASLHYEDMDFGGGLGIISGNTKRADRPAGDDRPKEADAVSGATRLDWRPEPGHPVQWSPKPGREEWNGTHYALQAFLDAIRSGETPSSDVVTGATSMLGTRLAIDASRTGVSQRWKREWDEVLES